VPPRAPEDQAKIAKATRIAYENAGGHAHKGEGDPHELPDHGPPIDPDDAFVDNNLFSEDRDPEDVARELYALIGEPTAWEDLTAQQRSWWKNRGRHTRRHSYCWEATVSGYWNYGGDLRASHFNADGHKLDDNPRGSLYHLALARRREAELVEQGHRPITKTVSIYDTSAIQTGPDMPPRIMVDTDGHYVSAKPEIVEPIGGALRRSAVVVTDRCHDGCLACGIESQEGAEKYLRSVMPISELDHDRLKSRLRRIEAKLGTSCLDDETPDGDFYGVRIYGDADEGS